MTKTHQITIHGNAQGFEELERRLLAYFNRKKVQETVAGNGTRGYILHDGLDVTYSSNGDGIRQLLVTGNVKRVQRGIDALLGMYSGTINVKYNI